MATRHLYLVRHGEADALGDLTDTGRRQAALLGERLAAIAVDVVHHSPLPRAVQTAETLGAHLPGVPVSAADELDDHVPPVPDAAGLPAAVVRYLAGYDDVTRATGVRLADALIARFARPAEAETREVLVTHAFQVAWLVRHALDAPPGRWLGLNIANAGMTAIEYRDDRPPALLVLNDQAHLPAELRWTGFPPGYGP